MRILLLGLDNAGKTTMTKKINGEDISEVAPTLGFQIKTMQIAAGANTYHLNIWDVGGQTTLRSYWRNYFEATDAVVFVVDCADTRRLQDAKRELDKLLVEEKLAGATLLIMANKQDLPGAVKAAEISAMLELNTIVSRHWHVQMCSAVGGDGLQEGINWMVGDIASRIFLFD